MYRALDYLESLPAGHVGGDAMWSKLAKFAVDEEQLAIAIRCYGQIGDIAKVRYLQKIEWISFVHQEETGETLMSSLKARAMLAQLRGDLMIAEGLYMERRVCHRYPAENFAGNTCNRYGRLIVKQCDFLTFL